MALEVTVPTSLGTIASALEASGTHHPAEMLAAVLNNAPTAATDKVSLANVFVSCEKFDAAAALLEAALREEASAATVKRLARVEYLRGNLIRAAMLYSQAAQGAPEDPGALIGRAEVEVALGHFGAAQGTLALVRAQLTERGHAADATATRLADLCELAIAKAGGPRELNARPAQAESPATPDAPPGALAARLRKATEDHDRDRAAMLLVIRRQAQVIERLKAIVVGLLQRFGSAA